MRTLLAAVAGLAAVAVGLAVLALVVLTTTSFGARFALVQGAELVPGEVRLGSVEGSFWTGIVLEDVRYRSDELTAELETLLVEPVLTDLANGLVVLDRLEARNGIVRLLESDQEAESAPDGAEALPLPEWPDYVAANEIRIENVEVEGIGAPLRIERAAGTLAESVLDLERVEVDAEGAAPFEASLAMRVSGSQVTGSAAGSVRIPEDAETGPADADAPEEEIVFDGRFDVTSSAQTWRAAIEWTQLEWAAAAVRSPNGRFVASPAAAAIGEAIDIELIAGLEGEALPDAAALMGAATLSGETLELHPLRIEALGGTATATGALRLDVLSGHLSIDYEGIDPSIVDEGLDGVLHGHLDAAVAVDPVLRVGAAGTIGGELGGRPLSGRIRGRLADDALVIEQAEVELDEGIMELAGTVSPESTDLRFDLELPQIGTWYSPASGTLTASGTVMGETGNPAVDVELEGENLALEDAPVPPVDRLAMSVEGRLDAHDLRVEASSELGRLSFTVEQGYADGRLRGTLLDSVLNPEQTGTWDLGEPAEFAAAGTEEIALERACYVGPDEGTVCLAVVDGALTIDANDLPNALAEPWLPEGLQLRGTADAQIEVALAGPLRGSVTFHQQSLTIGVETESETGSFQAQTAAEDPQAPDDDGNGERNANSPPAGELSESNVMELLDLADVTLSATIGPEGLQAELGGGPEALDEPIQGELALSPLSMEGQLDGRIIASVSDIAVAGTLVDGIESVGGEIEATLNVAGTPQAPVVSGTLAASGVHAEIPPLGIGVAEGRMTADVDGLDEVTFEGELCSDGCAALAGRMRLPGDEPWAVTMTVEGERFEVADLPDLYAVVAPDLTVEASSEGASVTGTVGIPEGLMQLEDLPRSAVRPAPETVVYGREAPTDEEEPLPVPLLVDVQARLGAVRFEGLGIEAELDGVLDVERTAEGRWLVQGQAEIEEGVFGAYGQELTIERGLLIFTGPPENPALDIRATRVVEGSEVGLAIAGTARNPRSEIFSEGGLSQSEALARLVTGRSLENAGATDPEALERAAIGLGLRRALPTLGRIGESLGLDELGVEAPGEAEGAIVAGKQLGDDVYLRYKHGLFDEFSGLELIYRITRQFRLRTETGTAQAIDLIYEMERAGADADDEDLEDFRSIFDEQEQDPLDPAEVVAPETGSPE